MTASGGRIAACDSASSAVVRSRRRSPPRGDSSAGHAGSGSRRRRRGCAARSRCLRFDFHPSCGKRKHEGGSLTDVRLGPDTPAVCLGEPTADGKAEPDSAGFARAVLEGLEDPVQFARADAWALVGHTEEHLVSRRRCGDTDSRTVGRELQRVLEQIDQYPLDLACVDSYRRIRFRQRDDDSVALAELGERCSDELVDRPQLRGGVARPALAGGRDRAGSERADRAGSSRPRSCSVTPCARRR